jgi:hypothetical protein
MLRGYRASSQLLRVRCGGAMKVWKQKPRELLSRAYVEKQWVSDELGVNVLEPVIVFKLLEKGVDGDKVILTQEHLKVLLKATKGVQTEIDKEMRERLLRTVDLKCIDEAMLTEAERAILRERRTNEP